MYNVHAISRRLEEATGSTSMAVCLCRFLVMVLLFEYIYRERPISSLDVQAVVSKNVTAWFCQAIAFFMVLNVVKDYAVQFRHKLFHIFLLDFNPFPCIDSTQGIVFSFDLTRGVGPLDFGILGCDLSGVRVGIQRPYGFGIQVALFVKGLNQQRASHLT